MAYFLGDVIAAKKLAASGFMETEWSVKEAMTGKINFGKRHET